MPNINDPDLDIDDADCLKCFFGFVSDRQPDMRRCLSGHCFPHQAKSAAKDHQKYSTCVCWWSDAQGNITYLEVPEELSNAVL